MNTECAFSRRHPAALLVWFMSVFAVTVLSADPIYALLSFCGAVLHFIATSEPSDKRLMPHLIMFMAAVTAINPVFSHHGVTVLFFLNDLPVTLEAYAFGAFMSAAAAASILWCRTLSKCMTSDKVIYLCGWIFPKLAVLISLILRFIPLFGREYRALTDAQRAMGMYKDKTAADKVRSSLSVFSALVSMVLEDSIDTADSMRARGVYLKGRNTYSDFKFLPHDVILVIADIAVSAAVGLASVRGYTGFTFYPVITMQPFVTGTAAAYSLFAAISLYPFVSEVIFWKRSGLRA